jgi:hypothetical protein
LAEHGFLGILAGLKALRRVYLVVEFGRNFEGELGFLEAPEWRSDLRWLATSAGGGINSGRERKWGKGEGEVGVECVILTRGGEHA